MKRDINWNYEEKFYLVEQVKKHVLDIENKTVDSRANAKKVLAWEEIRAVFKINGYNRDLKKVKEQWKRMKVGAKSNISNYKKHKYGTGGGPAKKTPDEIDYAIEALIPMDFIDDICAFDSDRCKDHTSDLTGTTESVYEHNNENTSSMPLISNENFVDLDNNEARILIPAPKGQQLQDLAKTGPNPATIVTVAPRKRNPDILEEEPKSANPSCSTPRKSFKKPTNQNMSLYEQKTYAMYEKKNKPANEHAKELHNLRKRWEEKVYKLKVDILKNKNNLLSYSDSD